MADSIKADPIKWNEAILGSALHPFSILDTRLIHLSYSQSPASYMTQILKPTTWGGAIEISILSAFFAIELLSLDVQSGRIDVFGTDEQGEKSGGGRSRGIIVYSGIRQSRFSSPFLDHVHLD